MDNYFWAKVIVAIIVLCILAGLIAGHNRNVREGKARTQQLKDEEEDRLFRAARKRKQAMELEEASRQQPMGMRVAAGRNPAEGKRPNNPPAPPPMRTPSRPSAEDNRRLDEIHRQHRHANIPSSSAVRDTHRDDDSGNLALLVTAAVVLSSNNDYCPPPTQSNDYSCPTPSPDYSSDTTSGSYD